MPHRSIFCFAAVLCACLSWFWGEARAGCPGCVPLDEPAGPAYLGAWPLGLYPGGTNSPPATHLTLALSAAGAVVPRDPGGAPDATGWIGMLSIGMSNANQEFAVYERIADSDPARNGRVIVVDAAVGGQSANVIADPTVPYWDVVDDRVRAAGLSPGQVQVVWFKDAENGSSLPPFPAHAETLQAHVRSIVTHLKDRFPNLQLCFLSSRIYGGYSASSVLGEPMSYEGGFGMRWLIEDQITGDPGLNADPLAGPVESAVLLWGPYLWANGTSPRASDGLQWLPADLESDFVHPSPSAEAKVAALLDGFFTSHAAATPWYLDDPGVDLDTVGVVADAWVDTASPSTNFGGTTELQWAYNNARAYLKFDLEGVTAPVRHAKLGMKLPADVANRPIEVVGVTNTTWDESVVTAATSPAFDGGVVDTIPMASRGTAVGVDVTAEVLAALALPAGSRRLSLGLRTFPGSSAPQQVLSRESGEGAWLVLTLDEATAGVVPPGAPQVAALDAVPNPWRGFTGLRLALRSPVATAEVAIFDLAGARVRTLHRGPLAAGKHGWRWDGVGDDGRDRPSGVYWARVDAGEMHRATRLVRLR